MRLPLWHRAKRDKSKLLKAKKGEPSNGSPKIWWTDEWLEGLESDLGCYPLVCRVERSHAEFPPDPYSGHKMVDSEGGGVKLTWTLPAAASGTTKKKKSKAFIRMALTLRPLTPVMPPVWNEFGLSDEVSLDLPPTFTVVTCPSSNSEPFLVPFAWAYCLTHSIAVGDSVKRTSKDEFKGKVLSFKSLGEKYGSFRLEEKMDYIRILLSQLKDESKSARKAIEDAVSTASEARPDAPTLPFADACVVIDYLNQFVDQIASAPTLGPSPISHVSLVSLIRSTLPLLNGLCIIDVYERKKHFLSRWNLTATRNKSCLIDHDAAVLRSLYQYGLPHKLDDVLREKIKCAIDDFIKNNEKAQVFVPMVTEDVAPGYYCAVPFGMSLQKILSRLKPHISASGESHCYYTSVESVLSDVQTITDNCVLYNSPDSQVVQLALDLIPSAKRVISEVALRHVRERSARMKAEEGRKRLIMHNCSSAAMEKVDPNDKRRCSLTISQRKNVPFKLPLERSWLERTYPDSCWDSTRKQKNGSNDIIPDLNDWVPQCGDRILYSRSLHSQFVKVHYHSLTEEQCTIPRFQISKESKSGTGDGEWGKDSFHAKDSVPFPELSQALHNNWLSGKVVWVRPTFPRAPGKEELTFLSLSPVLIIGLNFDYDWSEGKTYEVCWRPCILPDVSPSQSGVSNEMEMLNCGACGIPLKDSFLKPVWIDWKDGEARVVENILRDTVVQSGVACAMAPKGLPEDVASTVDKCLDILKRRCLNGIPADFVDARLCMENLKQGVESPAVNTGSKSLPTFACLLEPKFEAKKIATRGLKKPARNDPQLEMLSKGGFLPLWCAGKKSADEDKTNDIPYCETVIPCPKLCLELLHLRLKRGYYREIEALNNDIIEGYVTSVFYLLSEPTLRKWNPLSAKKIAKYLSSPRGNNGSPSYNGSTDTNKINKKGRKKKVKDSLEEGNAQVDPTDVATPNPESKAASSLFTLNEEESELVSQIDKIRRLYATVSGLSNISLALPDY